MNPIQDVLNQDDWLLRIEIDPNVGGDGTRVRISGDPRSFRNLAHIMQAMADTVDDKEHPAGHYGWSLLFGGDMPQFEFQDATFLALSCSPGNGVGTGT